MNSGIVRFHRCPFCRRGEGEIGIDIDAVQTWQPHKVAVTELLINDIPDQPVVAFQPDRVANVPCPHIVYMVVDIDISVSSKERLSRTFTWLNPWFREYDPAHDAFWFMWEAVVESDGPRTYEPSYPYRVRRPGREKVIKIAGGLEQHACCQGWVISSTLLSIDNKTIYLDTQSSIDAFIMSTEQMWQRVLNSELTKSAPIPTFQPPTNPNIVLPIGINIEQCDFQLENFTQPLLPPTPPILKYEAFCYKTIREIPIFIHVYLPKYRGLACPIMLFIHGGGWVGGSHSEYCYPLFSQFLSLGFIVTSMDYRLLPEASLEEQLEDVRDVEIWLRNHLASYFTAWKVAGDDIIVVGASAGAHLALLTVSSTLISDVNNINENSHGYGESYRKLSSRCTGQLIWMIFHFSP